MVKGNSLFHGDTRPIHVAMEVLRVRTMTAPKAPRGLKTIAKLRWLRFGGQPNDEKGNTQNHVANNVLNV